MPTVATTDYTVPNIEIEHSILTAVGAEVRSGNDKLIAALAPMAGHEGRGLGFWCEILLAILPGGNMIWQLGSWIFDESSRPSWHIASFTVIYAAAPSPLREFQQRLRRLIDERHTAPTAAAVERVLRSGEREWSNYHRAKTQGIHRPADVQDKLRQASKKPGMPLGNLTFISIGTAP